MMQISEMLYVGTGPTSTQDYTGVVECATAWQAKHAIRDNNSIVIVPTTDVARETLLMLGYGEAWSSFATQRRDDDSYSNLFLDD